MKCIFIGTIAILWIGCSCNLLFQNNVDKGNTSSRNTFKCITIGGADNEGSYSIIQSNDGGYAIVGYTCSYGAGGLDVYVVKLDNTGALSWTRTIGGANDDWGNSIIQTSDDGYAIAGMTYSFGAGSDDIYIVKLNSNGDTMWTRTIGGAVDDDGLSIIQTSDDGYVIAGSTSSFGAGYYDVYVIKLDSNGNTCCVIGNRGTVGTSNPTVGSGGTLGTSNPLVGSGGTVGTSIPTVSSGGTLTIQCP